MLLLLWKNKNASKIERILDEFEQQMFTKYMQVYYIFQ